MTPTRRRHIHGPVRPMQPTLWQRCRYWLAALRNTWSETPWFERGLCFYMIAIGAVAITYAFTGA